MKNRFIRNRFIIFVLGILLGLQACHNDDATLDNGMRRVKSFDKIAIFGDIVIKVQKAPSTSAEVELKINSTPGFILKYPQVLKMEP